MSRAVGAAESHVHCLVACCWRHLAKNRRCHASYCTQTAHLLDLTAQQQSGLVVDSHLDQLAELLDEVGDRRFVACHDDREQRLVDIQPHRQRLDVGAYTADTALSTAIAELSTSCRSCNETTTASSGPPARLAAPLPASVASNTAHQRMQAAAVPACLRPGAHAHQVQPAHLAARRRRRHG